ncbi:MAG TPA: YdcF family protein [Myxococcota bacterium]|nr:YdcF family protein [Myxococcota bacterium]
MRLFRRRQVWVPTVWTWLALALLAAVALFAALHNVYAFLAPSQLVGARVLVVEGWMPDAELEQAPALIRSGRYERIVTTGGPIERDCERVSAPNYAERARDTLVRAGVPAEQIVAAPAPASAQERTFLNAVMVREWAERAGAKLDSVDVFSSGVHSRRTWLVYGLAFGPSTRVGIFAATPSGYDPVAWWRTSAGSEEVLGQAIAWLWTELLFRPGPRGSSQERWAVPG